MFNFLKPKRPGHFSKKPVVLLSLDGFGIAPPSKGNAITSAQTPNFDKFKKTYGYGELIAAGESVGLPANEAGNSEVGHLTMGVGRVIYQSLPRINMSIEDGSFFENQALVRTIDHVKKNNSKLHILGLVSSGNVHSSFDHYLALTEMMKRFEVPRVCVHAITDGRDAAPDDGVNVVTRMEEQIQADNRFKFATIQGRYYAMDRDGRWERTQKAYEAIVAGTGGKATTAVEAVKAAYSSGKTDEFIEPTIITNSGSQNFTTTVDDNDAVIFFNFRIDRPRQLTMAFVLTGFETLKTVEFGYIPHESKKTTKEKLPEPTFTRSKVPQNLYFTTMTEYQKNLPVTDIAFPPLDITNSLPEVLSNNGLSHMHLAESEKERMVTFYFDGMREEPFKNEDVKIVPSPGVSTYDKKPEMSVYKILKEFKKALYKDKYDFFMINFANPDMVGHTGNIKAAIEAIEHVDKATGELVEETLAADGWVFITADHGNCEEMLTYPTSNFFVTTSEGLMNTEHSNNPIPLYAISKSVGHRILTKGTLADVAPTILGVMGITKPVEMTGTDLLKKATPAQPVFSNISTRTASDMSQTGGAQ